MRVFRLFFYISVAVALPAEAAEPALTVSYGKRHLTVTGPDFANMPQTTVATPDHERLHNYPGVAVRDLLRAVGVPIGDDLRRPALSLVVRVKGADGFACAFALAEFHEAFSSRTILLATHQDDTPALVRMSGRGGWSFPATSGSRDGLGRLSRSN